MVSILSHDLIFLYIYITPPISSYCNAYRYKHANGYSGSCVRDEDISLDNPCGNGEATYVHAISG